MSFDSKVESIIIFIMISVLCTVYILYDIIIAVAFWCPSLTDPSGGEVTVTSDQYYKGDVATYSCHGRFTLKGTAQRTCLVSRNWSDSEPSCERKKLNLNDKFHNYQYVYIKSKPKALYRLCQTIAQFGACSITVVLSVYMLL